MRDFTYQWLPEDYDDLSQPILKITKSSFGSFQWCPKKYYYSYYERLPQDTTEAMIKGTVVHNVREDFFNEFDVKKAEHMSFDELVQYNLGLHPIDDYGEIYQNIATFEANRFIEAREMETLDDYLPVVNEEMLDAGLEETQEDIFGSFEVDTDATMEKGGKTSKKEISFKETSIKEAESPLPRYMQTSSTPTIEI